ncbi:MAG: succinate dehydrogenase, cytochrome b556 subunit [Candidatus Muproteobacteria bacterium RBG_16_60_9]|jgi:succinate dehydrogenase / fumarate reductase cytochrome b subunit|uniref:Succinate dehydrogenase cytochrome b556 subunit n=1 Tax=Candidatus Muproteobacteria bacterium RBG_16_60_9 TaxID=1817755 RepID=A0A1F6UY27_9PROT|nr:MAG: succinate dehydrogenase, cytochrome b556 subunit [Candidatus Muproteobacteria bacterium RBG_16_60_9]
MQHSVKRPVYLNLFLIRLPIGGVVSILHRITGLLLALLMPFFLWALQASIESSVRFGEIKALLHTGLGRAAVLLMLWILIQHFYSGIRHLLIDVDIGVERAFARRSAWLTLIASVGTVLVLSAFV